MIPKNIQTSLQVLDILEAVADQLPSTELARRMTVADPFALLTAAIGIAAALGDMTAEARGTTFKELLLELRITSPVREEPPQC